MIIYPSSHISCSESQKRKSRDAARQRRGQQNDEFTELASQLPIMPVQTSNLDRLCVMRLSNSFVKMKHIIKQVTGEFYSNIFYHCSKTSNWALCFQKIIQAAFTAVSHVSHS